MESIAKFKSYKVTATSTGSKKAPWTSLNVPDNWNHHKIAVYNSDNKKRTTFDFWASLMNPEIVEEDDILNAFYCFITDATAGDADFYEFCHDFGYDPDENPEAKRAWKGCKAAMKKAERILTDDIYDLANELSDKCG